MSSDLISRSDLLKAVYGFIEQHRNDSEIQWTGYDWLLKEDSVNDLINSLPIAYDVDKVVEQLEQMRDTITHNIALNSQDDDVDSEILGEISHYQKIIQVVKSGGID